MPFSWLSLNTKLVPNYEFGDHHVNSLAIEWPLSSRSSSSSSSNALHPWLLALYCFTTRRPPALLNQLLKALLLVRLLTCATPRVRSIYTLLTLVDLFLRNTVRRSLATFIASSTIIGSNTLFKLLRIMNDTVTSSRSLFGNMSFATSLDAIVVIGLLASGALFIFRKSIFGDGTKKLTGNASTQSVGQRKRRSRNFVEVMAETVSHTHICIYEKGLLTMD
jgi:hypothetical protein